MEKVSSHRILIAGFPPDYSNYEQALVSNGLQPMYPSSRNLSYLCTLDFDLLLLPGGGDISALLYDPSDKNSHPTDYTTDLLQFQLLQLALFKSKPVLGICKGMQLLNVYFGGSLYTHLPTADVHLAPEKDLMHRITFAPHFPEKYHIFGNREASALLFEHLRSYPAVNSAHHQGVRALGENLVTIQYSEDYIPETIAHKNLPILGLQWHPERLEMFKENTFGKLIRLLLQSAQL